MERDDEQGWIRRVVVEAIDTRGRALRAVGTPVSRMIINRHTFIDINSLVRWDLDGVEGWGEDQDMWPVHTFAARQRARRTTGGHCEHACPTTTTCRRCPVSSSATRGTCSVATTSSARSTT